jgi:hypothetical protein
MTVTQILEALLAMVQKMSPEEKAEMRAQLDAKLK